MSIFEECVITLDLGSLTDFKEQQTLRKNVIEHGGVISYIVTQKNTHVIVPSCEYARSSFRCERAIAYNIPVVTKEFIIQSINAKKVINISPYLVFSKQAAEQSITCSKVDDATKLPQEKKRMSDEVNLSSYKIYKIDEKVSYWDDKEKFDVPQYIFLQGEKRSKAFHLFELQVQRAGVGKVYRIMHQFGDDISLSDQHLFEYRITQIAIESQVIIRKWSELCSKGYAFAPLTKLPDLGSKYMYEWHDHCKTMVSLSKHTSKIVNLFWNEAQGNLDDILKDPIQSYTIDNVNKAVAILMQLKDCIGNKSQQDKVAKLGAGFYELIKHRNDKWMTLDGIRSISMKLDLCQLIKDMVSVSESSGWSLRSNIDSKYSSLGSSIEYIQNEAYDVVSQKVYQACDKGEKINIINIYEVHRMSEESFQGKGSGPFFHASQAKNFVGILSRGLLLPNVVVDDHGGMRTDAGMLGSGIYFASSPTTCIKYSQPSKISNTRFMLLCQLDLGKTKDYYKFSKELREPPSGYDSTHGVKGTKENPSEFKDDEYCIYDVKRQKITHIIEFNLPGDEEVEYELETSEDEGIESDIGSDIDTISLDDVTHVDNPLEKVIPGLQSTGDTKIPLKEVHIRAKLQDLASEVIVLQAYTNESEEAIEAKYVFPLDELATVCGFEAFINGKHVVGKVKEKEEARKEYKEAISKGHGAYLMEEQEEQADVFIVSIGNLPPQAEVLIKITYVAELPLEGENITFVLPGSVAPWTKDSALASKIQDDVTTVNVEETSAGIFSLQISVEMPYDIKEIFSHTHTVQIKQTKTKAVVKLCDQPLGDAFQLFISLAEIHVPRMCAQIHPQDSNKQASMLTFFPQLDKNEDDELNVMFLIDASNSMQGNEKELRKLV